MAKYTSDANLIRGAGIAYKDWENIPGMYAGLDKAVQAGIKTVDTAVKGYEAEQKKIEEEAKAAKAKQEAIEKSWNDSADQVLLNAGALGDTIYNSTTQDVKKLKELYLQGVNEKDDEKRMSALRGLQGHSTWIQDHKQMNLDYAAMKRGKNPDGTDAPELSNYFQQSEKGREESHIITQIMGQKYKKTSRRDGEGENNDVVFHVTDIAGNPIEITSEEYNNMVLPKNYAITANTEELQIKINRSEIVDPDATRQSIRNSLPNSERDFIAAMHDDVSGKNLTEMLRTSTTLDAEIISAVNAEAWDADTDGILDEEEKENFIDAVINPDNEFFNLENSKQIMEDQIFNGVNGRHQKHWEKINEKKNASRVGKGGGGGGGGLKGGGGGGLKGNIDLGVSRLVDAKGNPSKQRLYANREDVKTKYSQIINAKGGTNIEGWDGKKTYQYQYVEPKSGKGFWLYQIYDPNLQEFVTKGGDENAAGGGGGVKHMSTNQVVSELIPQTMLSKSR